MSACISRHGEYSEHTPDAEWVCTLCGDVDTAGLRAEVKRLRAGIEALHRPEPFHDDPTATFCAHCQRTAGVWPCETAALLNPTGGENDGR